VSFDKQPEVLRRVNLPGNLGEEFGTTKRGPESFGANRGVGPACFGGQQGRRGERTPSTVEASISGRRAQTRG